MATLQYDFRVVGTNAVDRALASVERRIAQFNASVTRLTGTPVSRSGTTSVSAHAARARGTADREAREQARAAAQAERYWRTAAQRSIDFRIKADEKAHQQRLRQIAQEERAQKSAEVSLDRQRSRAITANARAAERHARMAGRERQNVARGIIGTGGRSVMGSLGAVGTYAGAALGLAGSFAMGSAVQTQLAESARASQLANQAGKPGIKGQLLKEAQGTKGFTGMEALEGLGSFTDITGDLDTARKLLPEMSRIALATSTDLADLGSAMGSAFIPLSDQIKDPTERLKAMNAVMKATAGMGAVGAVEVKDLAGSMAGLAASSNKFTGNSQENLNKMVAIAQAARQRGGAQGAEEAVTSVARFSTDLLTKPAQKRLNQLGVNVFSDKTQTQLKDPTEIIVDVLKKTKGNLVDLNNIFGERGVRAVGGFSPLFTQAEAENAKLPADKRQKTGEAGATAVRGEMNRLLQASVSDQQIGERVQSRLQDPDMLMKENMKKFNAAVGSELLPVLIRLIPEFAKLIPSLAKAAEIFARLVESAAKDPFGAVFKIIAAKLMFDLAGAGIGQAVKNGILRLIGGAGSISIPGGAATAGGAAASGGGFLGAPTAAGMLGAAGAGLAIGGAVASGIYATGVGKFEAGEASMNEGGQALDQIRALSGKSNADEFRSGRDALDMLEEKRRQAYKTDFMDDFLGFFGASNKQVEQKTADTMLSEGQAAFAKAVSDAQAAAGQQQIADAKAAGEAFKVAVSGARPPLNRGNTPASPVP